MALISSFFSPFLQVPPSSVEDLLSSEKRFVNVRSILTSPSISLRIKVTGRGELPGVV